MSFSSNPRYRWCLLVAACYFSISVLRLQYSLAQAPTTGSNLSLAGNLIKTLNVGGKVDDLAWIPNSSEIVVITQAVRPGPRSVGIWDTLSGQSKREVAVSEDPILSVAVSRDGSRIAAGVWREPPVASEVRVWNTRGDDPPAVFLGKSTASEGTNMKSEILGVAISPDGSLLAGAFKLVGNGPIFGSHIGGEVCVWDLASGELKWSDRTTHTDIVYAITFSPNGQTLASGGSDKLVRLWQPATGELQKTLHGAAWDGITSLTYLRSGELIASGGVGREEGHLVRVWEVKSGRHLHTLGGFTRGGTVRVAGHVPSSIVFAVGMIQNAPTGEPMWQVRCWDAASGKLMREFDRQPGYCRAIAVKADGSQLAVGTAEGQVIQFNLNN